MRGGAIPHIRPENSGDSMSLRVLSPGCRRSRVGAIHGGQCIRSVYEWPVRNLPIVDKSTAWILRTMRNIAQL